MPCIMLSGQEFTSLAQEGTKPLTSFAVCTFGGPSMVWGLGFFQSIPAAMTNLICILYKKRRIGRFTTPNNRLSASCKSQYMLADSHVHSSSVRTFSKSDSYQVEAENDPNSH
jgi:hypothetical protein